jgi:lipid-binding SYLF domain-containing protein
MNRFLAMATLATTVLTTGVLQTACSPTNTPSEQQSLVDRATLTVQDMMTQNVSQDPKSLLRSAKAVMVCPRIFKAGFFFGGEGGNCVLLARAGNGTWSYPAFYNIGSGSFGFQFGIEDNQLLMLIMTEHGLNAVLDSQIKLGANAGIAIATLGAGVQGSTTTAVGADIVAFAASRGLFGGVALEGSVMSADSHADQSYYGQPLSARQLVIHMQGGNPGADPMRDVLTRYGSRNAPPPMPPPPSPQQQQGYAPAYPQYQPQAQPQGQPPAPPPPPNGYMPPPPAGGRGPVQEQSLSPPAQ